MALSILINVVTTSAQSQLAADRNTTAFDGYDLTEFFNSKVVKGSKEFAYQYQGVNILFASQENLELFKSDPGKYFPSYGGWCAIAMTEDTFVIPDYRSYKIQDGRLFFFRVKAFFNGLAQWNKKPDKNVMLADKNYFSHFD